MRVLQFEKSNSVFLQYSEKKLPTLDDSVHFHNFYEIEYVSSGAGVYFIDGKKYEITPGKLCLVSPLNAHAFLSHDAEIATLSFSATFCDITLLSQFDFAGEPIWITLNDRDRNFFKANMQEIAANTDDLGYVSLILNALISKIGKNHFCNNNTATEFSPIRNALLYIATNFKKKHFPRRCSKARGSHPFVLFCTPERLHRYVL